MCKDNPNDKCNCLNCTCDNCKVDKIKYIIKDLSSDIPDAKFEEVKSDVAEKLSEINMDVDY